MAKNRTYRKKLDDQGNPVMVNGDFVLELVNDVEVDVYPDLESFKAGLRAQVDEQTRNGIYAGFTYDNILFSMSDQAQINWTNFPNLPSGIFPLTIYGKNDVPYSLAYADRLAFYGAALVHKNGHLQAGNTKKGQINACTTIQELKTLADSLGLSY
jgi:hypothetical protein